MAWWDELFGMTPNAAGAAVSANEPVVGKYRGANGSFDPNAIAGLGPAELADDTRSRVGYANAAREMLPPEEKLTWNRALGNVLSAASVPVAYAQGNTQYGSAMTGNTLADQWNARRDETTDARRKAEYSLGTGVLAGASDAASSFYESKRKRRTEAVDTVAKMIAMSNKDPEAIKEGAAYLRTLGLTDDASYVESMAAQSAPVAPASPAPMTPAPGSAEAMGDTLPNLAGGLAQAMPPAEQAAAMAASDPATAYQMPAEIQALYNRATRAEMLGTGNAAALMKQADAVADIWKKKEAARFSSRDGTYSVQGTPIRDVKTGKTTVGQLGPDGKLIKTEIPDGYEYVDQAEMAGSKQMNKDYAIRYKEIQDTASGALDQMSLLNMGAEALATGVYTGLGADAVQGLRKLSVALGAADADTVNQVAGGELIEGVQNRMALLMRSGGQMPGALSDNDIKFLKASQFGLDKTPEANRRMVEAFTKMAQRKLDVARLADEYIGEFGQLDQNFNKRVRAYAEANPLFPPVSGDNSRKKAILSKYSITEDAD